MYIGIVDIPLSLILKTKAPKSAYENGIYPPTGVIDQNG